MNGWMCHMDDPEEWMKIWVGLLEEGSIRMGKSIENN
jgi:hypothetical protein